MSVDARGRPGAENMAADQALLEAAHRSGGAFLRLYRWDPPCLSLGRNEPASARYDRQAIARRGLAVVRRPTGGRAVWHEDEVTYAVAAPIALFGTLRESHQTIHERLALALRRLGAPAELASPDARAGRLGAGACFASPAAAEILVGGRKIVGSAQVRQGTAFLQHGSILLDGSQDIIQSISRQASARSRAITLSAILGRAVTFDEVADAIRQTWGDALTSTDLQRPPPASTVKFSDPTWTWRR